MYMLRFILWNLFGGIIFLIDMFIVHDCRTGDAKIVMNELNPIWQYRTRKVNWVGAILLSMFWNLLCPIISIVYWLYKICTIGR